MKLELEISELDYLLATLGDQMQEDPADEFQIRFLLPLIGKLEKALDEKLEQKATQWK